MQPPAGEPFGKFVRTQKLGAGAAGEVWKAWDTLLGRWVALKLLRHDDEDDLARFKREAQTAARLSHPNVAAVYEVGEAAGRPYIAMQYVDGRTLLEAGRGSGKRVATLVRDAALGVQHAHEHGVVHRDIKPANIMVDGCDRVTVMDFGLAKHTAVESSISVSGAILGTPAYMSPEQAQGRTAAVDARSDVYGLGATLYQLVAGRPVFEGATALDVLTQVAVAEPAALRSIRPEVAADLETIVMKCLEKEPERRYATAKELAADLGRFIEGEAIAARPASLAYRLRKRLAKRRAVVAVAAAGLIAVAGAAALVAWRGSRREEALKQLGTLWSETATVREWTRQPFRRPAEIRAELERLRAGVSGYVDAHPDHAQGRYVRAMAALYLGDLDAAEGDLGEAVRIEPSFAPGWALLGHIRMERYTRHIYGRDEAERKERIREGAAILRMAEEALGRAREGDRAIERWGLARTREDAVNETLAEALRLGWVEKRWNEARDILKRAHEKAPSEEYCRWIGMMSDGPGEKIEWLTRAIEIAPHYARAYLDRADTRPTASPAGLDAALADYDRAIDIDPRLLVAILNRCVMRSHLGDVKGCLEDCERALALNPGAAPALYVRACVRAKAGDLGAARADLDRAIALDARYADSWRMRGSVRYMQGDLDGGLADYDRALEIDPRYVAAFVNRARCRVNDGDVDGAIGDCDRAVEVDPRHADAHFTRANLRTRKGDPKGAVADYDRVIELEPRNADAHLNRASERSLLGDSGGALADAGRAIELRPGFALAHGLRAVLREKAGDDRGAVADAREAIRLGVDAGQRRTLEALIARLGPRR